MALSAHRRALIPRLSFAYPKERKYPIDTKARARNALARAADPNNFGTYEHVAAAVRRKYGNTIQTKGK